jgi:hypothetical protein
LRQNKLPDEATDGRQSIDMADFHQQQPKQVTIDSTSDVIADNEKKNSIEQTAYHTAQDKIPQEAVKKDLWHDLGLETVEVDGIEVNDKNILQLINNRVQ